MSFDEILLPAAAIADLYANTLVALPHAPVQPTENGSKEAEVFPYLGKNQKNITVLVNYPQETHLPQEQLRFVENIFKACNLHTDDLAIVNSARLKGGQHALTLQFQPSILMVFGDHTGVIEASEHFTLSTTGGITVLCAPELEKLTRQDAESRVLKSRLWLALKQLFNV